MKQMYALLWGRVFFITWFAGFAIAPASYGRLLDQDPDEIDREDLLNSENYNDEISYRPPIFWEHLYDVHRVALRVNGGSYDSNRFMYEEDIKLVSPEGYPVTFRFLQEREQNLLGNYNERELRITANGLRPLYLAIMADGDSYKRIADLGLSARYEFSASESLEAYYWSVNHLYNIKREEGSRNRIKKPTRTWGAILHSTLPLNLSLKLKAEWDTPYLFDAPDEGYDYEYERQHTVAALSRGSKVNGQFIELAWHREIKREAKTFYGEEGTDSVSKQMDRTAEWIELRQSYGIERAYHWTNGLLFIARDANYSGSSADKLPQAGTNAEPFSPSIERNELGAYSTIFHYLPMQGWESMGYQLGLFLNAVRLNQAGAVDTTNEIKLQAAWTYLITDSVQTFLNATFNVDGLYQNYPYNDKAFKPWDGGALNIIATF